MYSRLDFTNSGKLDYAKKNTGCEQKMDPLSDKLITFMMVIGDTRIQKYISMYIIMDFTNSGKSD